MKIAFFVIDLKTPSSRFRVLQYLPYLDQRKIQYDVFTTPLNKWGLKLRWLPSKFRGFLQKFSALVLYFPIRYLQIKRGKLGNYDIIFLQKPLSDFPHTVFLEKEIYKKNPNIIFDIDDALFWNSNGKENKKIKILDIIRLSKAVIFSNGFLAKQLDQDKTSDNIFPTVIDEFKYEPKKDTPNKSSVCIGWTGTASNLKYLINIKEVIKRLSEKYNCTFNIISNRSYIKDLADIDNIKFVKWKENTELNDLQEFDIGIMPLEDNEWTRGKAGFKIIQYMAIGIPSVASPVGVNKELIEHGTNGFLANNVEEWELFLEKLILDKALRTKMGTKAREKLEIEYSIKKNVDKMVELFQKVMDK